MPEFNESTVHVDHVSEMTVKITAPDASLNRLTVRRFAGDPLDEGSLRKVVEIFAVGVAELDRAITTAAFTQKDCIEITTPNGTTIRINCPVITIGEPTIE